MAGVMPLLLGLAFLAGVSRAASPNLVQKPYLQQLTHTGVIIMWMTQTGITSTVTYGVNTGYGQSAAGSARPLQDNQLHRVQLTNLQPDTTYYYKLFTGNEDLLPEELLQFHTAPAPGSLAPFTFMVFGDFGKNSDSQKALRDQMLADSFRFILTTGDNAYNSGTYSEFYTNVFQVYQNLFSHTPVFPTPGNHDYYTGSAAPYLDLFDLPRQVWRTNDQERYYSFDYGNVHVAAIDSNTPLDAADSAAADDMFDWLRHDLGQTAQRWKIVALHHAAYSTGQHGSDSRVQAKLVPIFEAYGVDLVFTGHDHIYQRSHPLRGGQITQPAQGGIVYLVSGAGSAASYRCGSAGWVAASFCSKIYGLYSRVTVNGDALTVQAIQSTGAVRNTYAITKTVTPLGQMALTAPAVGLAGVPLALAVTSGPVTTTLPITYEWQAGGQPLLTSPGGLAATATFTWPVTGTYTITVTATNAAQTKISRTVQVSIAPVTGRAYLPVVIKK